MTFSRHSRPAGACLILSTVLMFAAVFAAPALAASLKPLPNSDLSKLSPDAAKATRELQQAFEKEKAGASGDDLAEAYATLAAGYVRADLMEAAEVAIYNAAQLSPQDDRWVYLQGVIARMRGDHASAERYFVKALSLNPDYLPIRIALAGERMRRNDLAGARAPLESYVQKNKRQPSPYALLGDIAMREKRYADAIDAFKQALTLDPSANQLYNPLAQAYTALGKSSDAEAAHKKAGSTPPYLDDVLLRRMQTQSTKTLSTQPQKIVTDVQRKASPPVNILALLVAGKYDEARRALDTALRQDPNDVDILAGYARTEAASGNLQQARKRALAAIAAGPRNVNARVTYGVVMEMSGDDASAKTAYLRALGLDDKSAEAQFRYAALSLRQGRYADAVEHYAALSRLTPANPDAWVGLLAARVMAGQCAAGIRDISEGLRKSPKNPMLLELFARVASTCPSASAEEKRMALDYAGDIYKAHVGDPAATGEAYALALAANGKWEDAMQTQAAAMYEEVAARNTAGANRYSVYYDMFKAKQMPKHPWPAGSAVYKPARPAPYVRPETNAAPAQAAPPRK